MIHITSYSIFTGRGRCFKSKELKGREREKERVRQKVDLGAQKASDKLLGGCS